MLQVKFLVSFLLFCICDINAFIMNLSMPGVTTSGNDEYICSSFSIPKRSMESYIISYEATTNSSIAHHILLYGCNRPGSTEPFYHCGSICEEGHEKILFAWGKDAQRFEYPTDTGMAVGGKTGIDYFVLQIHYMHTVKVKDYSGLILTLNEKPTTYVVGIFLLFSYYGIIQPRTRKAHLDVSCRYQGISEAYTLAFRTHAHSLGRSISGFRVSLVEDQIDLIGKGNPQWPQTFYKSAQILIKPGDILMARCLYDSSNRDTVTNIGATHTDEMCNFYIMLVTKNNGESENFISCGGDKFKELWNNIPSYSMDYDPPNPSPDLLLTQSSINNYGHVLKSLDVDENWKVNSKLGDVTSISILYNQLSRSEYSLFVFHRGSHKWTESSFINSIYQGESSNPIPENTILEVNSLTGNILRNAGSNMFYLPHGITVTKDGKYVWVTDVALHQIMRFKIRQDSLLIDSIPDILLGERFIPGNDQKHFCQPTKVAIDSRGFVFVADGYCNERIVCLSPNGTYLNEWRLKDGMFIVHSITIEEDKSGEISKNVVWVADRENKKLVGFHYDGSVKSVFSSEKILFPIFGIEYNSHNRLIYGITANGNDKGMSFTFNTTSFSLGHSWSSNYVFHSPHDICMDENGSTIFLAELHLQKVVRFHKNLFSEKHLSPINNNFNNINSIVKNISPTIIGVSLILLVILVVICIMVMKYYRRYHFMNDKLRRYGHSFKDKEGFRPLTQNEDEIDDVVSDPETEEYSAPRGHPLRKPKA